MDRDVAGGDGGDPLMRFGVALSGFASLLALVGGGFLIVMALFTASGIMFRALSGGGITGDFEIVELLSAYSVFLFFPYAHRVRQHIAVSFFADRLPGGMRRVVFALNEAVFTLVSAVVTWRIAVGGVDAWRYADVGMMLRLPVWILYVPGVIGWGVMTLVSLWFLIGKMPSEEVRQ